MKDPVSWLIALGLVLAVLAVGSLGMGAVAISPRQVLEVLWEPDPERFPTATAIVWELRLPRILLACAIGAGLGAAGAGCQGLFRNPLADPFVIGASSGAALGATLAIVTGSTTRLVGWGAVPLAALGGALATVALVYAMASIGRYVPTLSLLLAGAVMSSFQSALLSLLMFMHDEKLTTIFSWLMGSLSGKSWPALWANVPLIAAGGAGLWLLARSLDSLTFGEETAAALGASVGRLRALVVLMAGLATAGSVAAGGIIGFVGLIAPHVARSFVGARHARVIPTSALLGALLLLCADDLGRTVAAPAEIPAGVVMALLGGPFFLYLLKTRQRELGAAW